MFDIKKLALTETATMPIRDASGEKQFDDEGNPLSITFHGPSTKQFQKTKHAAEQRNSDRMVSKMQGKSEGKVSWSDKLEERAVQLANCTVSFNNFGIGKLTGHELYKALYSDLDLIHIADDAEKFLNEKSNFTKPSLEG